ASEGATEATPTSAAKELGPAIPSSPGFITASPAPNPSDSATDPASAVRAGRSWARPIRQATVSDRGTIVAASGRRAGRGRWRSLRCQDFIRPIKPDNPFDLSPRAGPLRAGR